MPRPCTTKATSAEPCGAGIAAGDDVPVVADDDATRTSAPARDPGDRLGPSHSAAIGASAPGSQPTVEIM